MQDELTILRMLSLSYAELEEMNEQCAIGFVDEANWKRYEVVAYERWWWSSYVHAMMNTPSQFGEGRKVTKHVQDNKISVR